MMLMLLNVWAEPLSSKDEKYGMVVDHVKLIANEIELKLANKSLEEPEIYTLLSSIVAFDTRVWSASLAFTPSLLDDYASENWSDLAQAWNFYKRDDKKLYAPYVWRSSNNVLHADNIANPESKFGYDYTNGQWAWWSKSISSGQPLWGKPVYSNLTGDHMITYSYPIKRDAVLIFNVYYGV